MKRPRYKIFDVAGKAWLAGIESAEGEIIAQRWSHKQRDAMLFPGTKTARRMIRRLGELASLVIVNGKGDIAG